MPALKVGTEEQGVVFAGKCKELIRTLEKRNESHYAEIVKRLVSDNIRMFARVKELEDGRVESNAREN